MMQPSKPRVLTGLRANKDLTIGNYLGGVLPMVNLIKKYHDTHDFFMFVPDLHSFTTPIDHSQLFESVINNVKFYMAAGAVTEHTKVYRQSFVPAHSELTWILDCFTGMGEMSRMTQFKDKSAKLSEDRISLGLFAYPVLMAADILLYHASYIPVGDDQTQHLEFTRDIAERLNVKFGNLFTVPLSVSKQREFFGHDQGLRIRDLQDPTKKMSKSDESGKGVIFLTDSPQTAAKKIMGATTDSLGKITYDFAKQPGISNLLQLLALLTDQSQATVNAKYEGLTAYGPLKSDAAKAVAHFLGGFQSEFAQVKSQDVLAKLEENEPTVRDIANQTLLGVQKAVGLRN